MDTLKIGLVGESTTFVTENLTARSMGSGTLAVFATPALIALMESAAMNALEGFLEDSQTSVGIHIDVKHIAAAAPGREVRAEAMITGIDQRRIQFEVKAYLLDDHRLIGEGMHTRYIVNAEVFLSRLENSPE